CTGVKFVYAPLDVW
nr:immunoglobulin heavy chain junction region [Macaca mulatta]